MTDETLEALTQCYRSHVASGPCINTGDNATDEDEDEAKRWDEERKLAHKFLVAAWKRKGYTHAALL